MLRKKCDQNIARTIDLANEMIKLAQSGYEDQEDPGCGVLYGILMDTGYRLLDLAQKEKEVHIRKGWWDTNIRQEKEMKRPEIDLGACIVCEICIETAPHAFGLNDMGFVEVLPLDDYSDEDILEAVKNCPKDCISWE